LADTTLLWLAPGALQTENLAAHAASCYRGAGVAQGSVADLLKEAAAPSLTVVLSAADALVTEAELTRKQARHLAKILPFLLEDQLIDAPDSLWFASGKAVSGVYPVVACDREGLDRLVAAFDALGTAVTSLVVDGQLLAQPQDQPPVMVRHQGYELLLPVAGQALVVPEADAAATLALLDIDVESVRVEAAPDLLQQMPQVFAKGRYAELLHSALRPKQERSRGGVSSGWQQSAWLVAASVALVAMLLAGQAYYYEGEAQRSRAQAASLYNELFPGDQATAVLESQFRNRLARLGAGGGGAGFLSLMLPVGETLRGQSSNGLAARRIQYDERESALTLDVSARDYESLEALRERIGQRGLQAEIANFRSQGDAVTARLRVVAGI